MQNLSAPFNAMRINGIISPDLETTNKKKYNAMESVLQEIQKAIQLPNDEVTRHNVIVKEILDAIIEELKATDPLFKLIYQKTLYGGSYYDGLKLNAPDEYDIDLALRLKELNPCLEISDIAGFVRVKVNLDKLKQKSNYADYRSVEKFIDGHNYLLTEKFREWFEGLVCKAKINIERKGSKYKFDLIKSGPAFTLKLKIGNKLVCVDLVPSIIFENDKWPAAPFKKNGTKKGEFLVVPKTPPNCSKYNTAWRLSFQDQEREIINGKNGLKDTIRLLKLLRSAQFQENSFPSYYIKTVMMLMIEVVDASFWSSNSRSYIFMMGLKYFSKLLENQQLPYYWNRSYNLLSAKKGITLENWSKRIDRIFKTLEKNLDSPSLRPEMLKFFGLEKLLNGESPPRKLKETSLKTSVTTGTSGISLIDFIEKRTSSNGLGILRPNAGENAKLLEIEDNTEFESEKDTNCHRVSSTVGKGPEKETNWFKVLRTVGKAPEEQTNWCRVTSTVGKTPEISEIPNEKKLMKSLDTSPPSSTKDHFSTSNWRDESTRFHRWRDTTEHELLGINVFKKLERMDPTQAIYAEKLITEILTQGLLKQLTASTNIHDNAKSDSLTFSHSSITLNGNAEP